MIAFRLLFQIPHERKMKQKIFLPIRSCKALWQKGRQKMKTLPSYLYSNINWLNFTVTDNQKHCVHTAWKKGHSFLAEALSKSSSTRGRIPVETSGIESVIQQVPIWNTRWCGVGIVSKSMGVLLLCIPCCLGNKLSLNKSQLCIIWCSENLERWWCDLPILPPLVTSIKVSY